MSEPQQFVEAPESFTFTWPGCSSSEDTGESSQEPIETGDAPGLDLDPAAGVPGFDTAAGAPGPTGDNLKVIKFIFHANKH